MLTQKRVRELFSYDRDTGTLTRHIAVSSASGRPRTITTYQQVRIDGKPYRVQTVVWTHEMGPVPAGMVVDHIDGTA